MEQLTQNSKACVVGASNSEGGKTGQEKFSGNTTNVGLCKQTKIKYKLLNRIN